MGYKYALKVGTILNGKYEIIPVDEENDILGVGGFGITYKCYDKSTNRNIVIKEFFPSDFAIREGLNIAPKSSQDKESFDLGLQSFIKETKILAKFHGHPNIVDIYERFEENNTSYFVMPFQKGQSLKDVMRERDFKETEIIKLVIGILDGLKAVHAEGVLHRDLKPDNIFMKEDDTPVLIDFGSAKNTLSERTKLLTGVAAVSAGYAAPEQYSRKLKQGPFTDIHALGIIIYQLITRSKDNDIPTSTDRTLDAPLEWPEALNKQYSNKLIDVAKRASSLIADDRYQDAMSMRHALLENPNRPVHLKNPPPPPPPKPPKEEPKLNLKKITITAITTVVALGAIYLISQSNQDKKTKVVIESNSSNSSKPPKEKVKKPSNVQAITAPVVSIDKNLTKKAKAVIALNSSVINPDNYKEYQKEEEKALYLGAMLRDAHYLLQAKDRDAVKFYFLINKIKLNGGITAEGKQKTIEALLDAEKWDDISKEIIEINSTLEERFKSSNLILPYLIGSLMEDYRLLVESINKDYKEAYTPQLINHPLLKVESIEMANIKAIQNQIKSIIAQSKKGKLSKEQVKALSETLKKMEQKGVDA